MNSQPTMIIAAQIEMIGWPAAKMSAKAAMIVTTAAKITSALNLFQPDAWSKLWGNARFGLWNLSVSNIALLPPGCYWRSVSLKAPSALSHKHWDNVEPAQKLRTRLSISEISCPAHFSRRMRRRASHTQYLDHWLNVIKTDKKAIFTAASEASEAAAFLAALVFRIKAKRGQLGAAWRPSRHKPALKLASAWLRKVKLSPGW
jgi:hypothetical protein